jgi:hypothetical protein
MVYESGGRLDLSRRKDLRALIKRKAAAHRARPAREVSSAARLYRPLWVTPLDCIVVRDESPFFVDQHDVVAVFARGEVFTIRGLERRLTTGRLDLLLQVDAGKTAGSHVIGERFDERHLDLGFQQGLHRSRKQLVDSAVGRREDREGLRPFQRFDQARRLDRGDQRGVVGRIGAF